MILYAGKVRKKLVIGDTNGDDVVDDVRHLWEDDVRAVCMMIKETCHSNNVQVVFYANWYDFRNDYLMIQAYLHKPRRVRYCQTLRYIKAHHYSAVSTLLTLHNSKIS